MRTGRPREPLHMCVKHGVPMKRYQSATRTRTYCQLCGNDRKRISRKKRYRYKLMSPANRMRVYSWRRAGRPPGWIERKLGIPIQTINRSCGPARRSS